MRFRELRGAADVERFSPGFPPLLVETRGLAYGMGRRLSSRGEIAPAADGEFPVDFLAEWQTATQGHRT